MVKERNPILVILFSVLSCGIYMWYWIYATSKELNEMGHLETGASTMLSFLFLGPLALLTFWKHAKAIEALSGGEKGGGMLFVIALLFAPGYWYMAQAELNKHATPAA